MQVKIHKIGQINESDLKLVVICAKHTNGWILVRHKDRSTWEMPGGHIDDGESAHAAALRELYEETGIIVETIDPICDYCVYNDIDSTYFRLYYVYIEKLSILPDFEIAEVKVFEEFPSNTTYPESYNIFIPQIMMYEKKRL